MGTISFYHYTNEDGKSEILRNKLIKASNPKVVDAAFGKGVYGNSMSPEKFSKEELAKNMYDSNPGFWEQLFDVGKVDYAIKISLPVDKVKRKQHASRDILLHEGDIDLSLYSYEVLEVPDYQRLKASSKEISRLSTGKTLPKTSIGD